MATRYTVKQGGDAFSPPSAWRLAWRTGGFGVFAMFEDSCRYDHGDADQLDYNKLCGLSFELFDNHEDSCMVGWRWNTTTEVFELTPYSHVRGKRIIGPDNSAAPVLVVRPEEWFAAWFDVDWAGKAVTVSLMPIGDRIVRHWVSGFNIPRRAWFVRTYASRRIGPWFGGNRKAPHDMALWLEDVTIWEADGTPVWDGRPL